ncbi:hypothetical protein LUZ62_033424 [Rhynchospora pubera]|uniref:Uncharacterized protein n=1 Tax=Rhynchospora pubera TaxID=906938 RepID=A0AAV8HSJ3_9POAL|nr:hypothetical protein LUZ62_033424 [Rhynchospora pubera]
MLVRDSCFIIRIIISLSREETESMFFPGLDIKKLRFDLLLLENQIPYFFLKRVYDFLWERHMLVNESPPSTISSLPRWLDSKDLDQSQTNGLPQTPSSSSTSSVYLDQFLRELNPFICLDMPWEFDKYRMQINEPDHLLDLYWKWCLPSDLDPETYLQNHHDNTFDIDRHKSWVKIHLRSNADKRIPNACELYRKVGVKFEKRKHQKGFGVEFHNGILQLPHLKLDQNQTTLLVNLIAFEDFKPSKDRVLTSYILLLDGLINTKKDVELLQQHGIIHNKLSSIESASTFFNDIGNICSVDYEDHYCRSRFKDLNNYYKSSWNRQFAKLYHTSFSSPWAVISLLVGALLLILAALQTGYTIASYYKQT